MSNKYWTDKTDKEDIIAAADFNNAFDNIASDMDENTKIAFDGTITTSLLDDNVNCPRTIGVFKVLKSDGNTHGVLISSVMGTETEARFQLYISPSSIGTMQVRWRKYDTTANEWSDWDIQRPKLITLNPNASPVSLNSIYAINQTGTHPNVIVNLPEGKVGDFVQYDFVTGETVPPVIIQSTYGMTKFDFTPEAKKIYSLFFDWGIIAVSNTGNTYGWRISFAEYDYDANVAEVLPEENL